MFENVVNQIRGFVVFVSDSHLNCVHYLKELCLVIMFLHQAYPLITEIFPSNQNWVNAHFGLSLSLEVIRTQVFYQPLVKI